jgi:hypothetical protein
MERLITKCRGGGWPAGLALLCLVLAATARAEIPTVLTDTVKSGSGTIDVMKDVTAAELEAALSSGTLLLAADLNETSSAPESPTSQGVAIEELELILTTTEGTFTFSTYYTNTTALIVPQGSTAATEYYTLFGQTGSNELTSSTSTFDLSQMDDVIEIQNISYTGEILDAQINIKLLDTAVKTGDTEQFFDYSAGFEEFAIVLFQDANTLDSANIGLADAPSTVTYTASTPSGGDIAAPSGAPEPHWLLLGAIPAVLLARRQRR